MFRVGDDSAYSEAAPAHAVTVSGFWMDECAITNAAFTAFVEATGHQTVIQRPLDPAAYRDAESALLTPGSAVFFMPVGNVDMNNIHCS